MLETDITIDFDDSIIEDKQTERQEDRQDIAMGAMSLQEYRAKWYGETEEVAEQKLPDQSGRDPDVILWTRATTAYWRQA